MRPSRNFNALARSPDSPTGLDFCHPHTFFVRMSEADIHFDFYRHLQNAVEDEPKRGEREVIDLEGVSQARESITLGDFD